MRFYYLCITKSLWLGISSIRYVSFHFIVKITNFLYNENTYVGTS